MMPGMGTTTYQVQALDSAHDFALYGVTRIVRGAKSPEDAVRKALVRAFGSGVRPAFESWDGSVASVRLQGGTVFLKGVHSVQAVAVQS